MKIQRWMFMGLSVKVSRNPPLVHHQISVNFTFTYGTKLF